MKLTVSLIKADVGSIGGHTRPSERMLDYVEQAVSDAIDNGILRDGYVSHTGDDIAILMTHTYGKNHETIHQFAWDTFKQAGEIAAEQGLYGAGQDLLADAPSGNVRGAGPGVAEIDVAYGDDVTDRPVESFLMFAADKCGPGLFNLPLFLGCADPMFCSGLMLPKMRAGFSFNIIDMENTKGRSTLMLHAPEDYYKATVLLRDNERFGISEIYSRAYDCQVASVSAQRLHAIAGKYVGKDDPVALVRTQSTFPAPEELLSPYMIAHYVGGDARGSHVMPVMPVAINTPVSGAYCMPILSCLAFSLDHNGYFADEPVDMFDNPVWDYVRERAQKKAFEIRQQGWSGPAMLPHSELEYSGFNDAICSLVEQFKLHKDS